MLIKTTAKHEVLIKQYMHSILDISAPHLQTYIVKHNLPGTSNFSLVLTVFWKGKGEAATNF